MNPSPKLPFNVLSICLVGLLLNQIKLAKKTLHNQAAPWHSLQVQCRNQLQLPPRRKLALRDGLQGPAAHRRVDPRHLRRCQRRGRARPEDLGPEPLAAAQGEAQQQDAKTATVKGTGGHGDAGVVRLGVRQMAEVGEVVRPTI